MKFQEGYKPTTYDLQEGTNRDSHMIWHSYFPPFYRSYARRFFFLIFFGVAGWLVGCWLLAPTLLLAPGTCTCHKA